MGPDRRDNAQMRPDWARGKSLGRSPTDETSRTSRAGISRHPDLVTTVCFALDPAASGSSTTSRLHDASLHQRSCAGSLKYIVAKRVAQQAPGPFNDLKVEWGVSLAKMINSSSRPLSLHSYKVLSRVRAY